MTDYAEKKGERDFRVALHAIQRYKERVDEYVTDEEAAGNMREMFEKGKVTKIEKNTLAGENIQKVFYEYHGITILVYKKPTEDVIVSCFGHRVYQKWYKKQKQQRQLRFSRM